MERLSTENVSHESEYNTLFLDSGLSTFFNEGAILTGDQILQEVQNGRIVINGFDEKKLNPNSYNVTLDKTILTYNIKATDNFEVDIRMPPDMASSTISDKYGYVIYPGQLYLGSTVESIQTNYFVPIITGRSSMGRLGLEIHQTGNFGDLGYNGKWTLQIASSAFPIRIYPNIEIAQIYFIRPYGRIKQLYHGKYQNSTEPTPSKLYTEMDL